MPVPAHPFASQTALARENATPAADVPDLQKQIDCQDRFLSMVSHELRNYVTMMKVTTQHLNKRKRHQGRIWVKSTPGKGPTFSFRLRLHEGNDGEQCYE